MRITSGPARVFTVISSILLFCAPSFAQKSDNTFRLNDFYFETRLGYEGLMAGERHELDKDASGFRGSWLNMRLDGQIGDRLSYSYRQRFTKGTSRAFFDATDWIHLDWKATDWLTLSGGKQVVAIGGYEYDRAPIDLYYCSEFWNNIACYQMGVSASFNVSEQDMLLAQVCSTPMRGYITDGYITDENGKPAGNSKMGFNFMWYGTHGFYETMWSANAFQNTSDTWMYYVALGNRFNITKWLRLDVDFMNRMSAHQEFFKDWSLMTEISAAPVDGLRIHLKYTWDYNQTDSNEDHLVIAGTDMMGISGGVEYSPLKDNRGALRLFALAGYNSGVNANSYGTLMGNEIRFQAGIKFRLGVLEGIKTLIDRK